MKFVAYNQRNGSTERPSAQEPHRVSKNCGIVVKIRPANAKDAEDAGLNSRSGGSLGVENGNPLQ